MTTIRLLKNHSENNKLQKTYTEISYMDGEFKDSFSLSNPVFVIQENYGAFQWLLECDYAYIPSLGRYYFITDIVCLSKDLFEIHLRVDVLMSFKSLILSQYAMIDRCEDTNFINPLLKDDGIPIVNGSELDVRTCTFFSNEDDIRGLFLYPSFDEEEGAIFNSIPYFVTVMES